MTRLLRVAVAGATGGAINAWLCYASIPVPAFENPGDFKWHVIPAGAVHGAALAAFAFAAALFCAQLPLAKRLAAAVPLGWLSGYASWLPLNLSAFGKTWSETIYWPFDGVNWVEGLWIPFAHFGLVAVCYYLWLTTRGLKATRLWESVAGASFAATLGSLWWWLAWKHWYFSILHGLIWGVLVGLGAGTNRAKHGVA